MASVPRAFSQSRRSSEAGPLVVFVGDWRVPPTLKLWRTSRRGRRVTNKVVNHIMSQQPRLKRIASGPLGEKLAERSRFCAARAVFAGK